MSSYIPQETQHVKAALSVIDRISDAYQNKGIREFPPRWRPLLKKCVDILKTSEATKEFNPRTIMEYTELGEYLATRPLLELHELHIEDL